MPLTELVLIVSTLIAYGVGLAFWLVHCLDPSRVQVHAGAPAWRRLVCDPVMALASGVPVLALVGLVLAWRILPALL
ncbi:hypothetical protein [Methylorubrum extorquens]|uniref:Uncharacterized protein n=1 Tax=Methylorubrum extorquens DSM 13060 TaxID=882800 RepID=H1KGT8_METEX|nr:hypothetical protein [Methylorubrum extorquens]EHP93254.1 hypothetical protein MetexDRAFT_1850 [Methylorubrum extorquens DSM 13060]